MARRSRRKKSASAIGGATVGQGASPSRISTPTYPSRAPAWASVSLMRMPPRLAQWTAQRSDRMARADSLLDRHLKRVGPYKTETTRTHSKLSLNSSDPSPSKKSSGRAREKICKERPDSKKAARTPKGSGGGKRFVPWC